MEGGEAPYAQRPPVRAADEELHGYQKPAYFEATEAKVMEMEEPSDPDERLLQLLDSLDRYDVSAQARLMADEVTTCSWTFWSGTTAT